MHYTTTVAEFVVYSPRHSRHGLSSGLEHGKTNIFLDCNGKNDDTFDLNKMVLAPNANVDESKDELYPFFINEAAYYEKGFGFA